MSITLSQKKNEGFVILYAVIITTVVLVVGLSLSNIITKQLVLSSISRSSKIAYYAALSGRECADFWKVAQVLDPQYLGGFDDSGAWVPPSDSYKVQCFDDQTVSVSYETKSSTVHISHFELDLSDSASSQKACAEVYVTFDSAASEANKIIIESDGYNTSCSSISAGGRVVKSIYRDKISE